MDERSLVEKKTKKNFKLRGGRRQSFSNMDALETYIVKVDYVGTVDQIQSIISTQQLDSFNV